MAIESRWVNPHDHRERDALGRKQPRRIPVTTFLSTARHTASEHLRKVPSRAVEEQGRDDAGDYSLVNCPCGGHPVVRALIAQCPGGCERWYVAPGAQVWVVYAGMEPPSA